ncbi:hypothetical protein EMIT053CA3_60125 [Pseudomonas donghuensis]
MTGEGGMETTLGSAQIAEFRPVVGRRPEEEQGACGYPPRPLVLLDSYNSTKWLFS